MDSSLISNNITEIIPGSPEVVNQLLNIVLFLQAIGVLIIIYLLMSVINYFRKRKDTKNIIKIQKDIEQIKKDLARIKNKI